jgi:hypothetical protein
MYINVFIPEIDLATYLRISGLGCCYGSLLIRKASRTSLAHPTQNASTDTAAFLKAIFQSLLFVRA